MEEIAPGTFVAVALIGVSVKEAVAVFGITVAAGLLFDIGIEVGTEVSVLRGEQAPTKNTLRMKIWKNFINELVKTGKFTEDEARNYLKKAMQNGQIYERKSGFYAKAWNSFLFLVWCDLYPVIYY